MYNEKTIEKLKQKILDLAIRGKLVPQDPNDEPASVLIEKIRKEKEKLIKEGKIKKPKEDSFIFKGSDNCYYENVNGEVKCIQDEIPFEIPESWCWARLNTIYTTINGYAFKKTDFINKGKIPIIKIANITMDGIDFNNCKYSNDENLSQYKALYGDIIIALSGATTGKMSIYDLNTKAYINQRTMILRPNNRLFNLHLLFYFVRSKTREILQNAYGGAQPNISSQEIENMLIPFPTLNQQEKLYEKLISINNNFSDLQKILNSNNLLKNAIKNKILNAIFSPNSSYKSYYENDFNLGEILEYEQPSPYIVKNTDYNDNFDTPVLTPGKTFILGYTNEKDGIYKADKENKVIIFDDFTTASRLVDFDFKVKSSAMKILHISDTSKFDIDYMFYLLQTINIIVDTHKRFWISEYAQLKVKIHTFDEQIKIKNIITSIFNIIDNL